MKSLFLKVEGELGIWVGCVDLMVALRVGRESLRVIRLCLLLCSLCFDLYVNI